MRETAAEEREGQPDGEGPASSQRAPGAWPGRAGQGRASPTPTPRHCAPPTSWFLSSKTLGFCHHVSLGVDSKDIWLLENPRVCGWD